MTKDHLAQILENARETSTYWRLRVRVPDVLAVRPGQFVMVRAQQQWEPLWRRALVIYRVLPEAEGTILEFLYKVLGRGTYVLSRQRPGDRLDVLGPLGNGFPLEEELSTSQPQGEALLVSGGIGLPALFLLAEALAQYRRPVRLFHGEAALDPTERWPALEDFARVIGESAITLTTEDGSCGIRGMVTDALQAYLDGSRSEHSTRETPTCIYACGPTAMLRRVAEIAARYELPAYVSVEARMACGFGVCLGCVVATRDLPRRIPRETAGFMEPPHTGDPSESKTRWDPPLRYRRACVEGPIFRAEEVVWDEL